MENLKKTLHSKRSFGNRHAVLDSPAYDASEEDNDPTDDPASAASSRANSRQTIPAVRTIAYPLRRHVLAAALTDDDDDGTDSPTYDGDIESSTTTLGVPASSHSLQHHYSSSVASTLSPASVSTHLPDSNPDTPQLTSPASDRSMQLPTNNLPSRPTEPAPAPGAAAAFDPAKLTPDDIQDYVRRAIADSDIPADAKQSTSAKRPYNINPPPTHRPVRIYADGVYDLFHFGHALQLRQAKLSFPDIPSSNESSTQGVYLLVGVNSDEECRLHKNRPVMTHAERCEAVRHCRWVDEIVADAPWVIDAAFLDKYKIDYVAHDESPYAAEGHDDVYSFCKSQGKFLPTRRTPGVSTSELLERIVSGYRLRVFDKKLEKMGHRELMAEGSDYDDSRPASGRVSRAGSVHAT